MPFLSSFSPSVKDPGSVNGVTMLAPVLPVAVIVPGDTVAVVTVELWQHKSLVLVIFVSGIVDGLNGAV